MKLSINQMRAVEAVVRTGSFSAAAKELGISQPSVSNHISALERHYHVQLINRNGRNAEATDACRTVLSRVRSILHMTAEVEQTLEGRKKLKSGSLRVGYSTYQFAMPILSDFMARFPEIAIEARAMASLDLLPMLMDGKFDVVFVTASEDPSGLHSVHIRTEHVVIVTPKDHPLAQKKYVAWHDLAAYPLVQREQSSETRRAFEKAAQQAGVELKNILALGSWGSIVSSVHAGLGVGVAMAGEVKPSDELAILPIEKGKLTVSHRLVCLPEMQHVASIDAMLSAARSASSA